MNVYLLLILLAAFLYALGVILAKRAIEEGGGSMRLLFVSNWVKFLIVVPFYGMGGGVADWGLWWSPLVASVVYFLGTVMVLVAIRVGDVTLQTPLMGVKVPMVAWLSVVMMGASITRGIWVGCGLTCMAVFLLGGAGCMRKGFRVDWKTVWYSMGACGMFGLSEVLSAQYGGRFGEMAFLVQTFGYDAVASMGLMPYMEGRHGEVSKRAWWWLGGAALALALEEVLLLWVICVYGEPTEVNIVYSTRGLWSVLLVWCFGKYLGNREGRLGGGVMGMRMAGAVLLSVAIYILMS